MARSEESTSRSEDAPLEPSTPLDARGGLVNRRTVLTGTALAVPAVTMTAWTPAWAASGEYVTVTAANMQVPAAGNAPVTATVRDMQGQPLSGVSVSFSGPAGSSFPPSPVVTDGTGQAVSQLDLKTPWAVPGSAVAVAAQARSASTSTSFTVLGSNLVGTGRDYPPSLTQSELAFPSPVVDATAFGTDVSVGTSMVLLADGTVWTKGGNAHGQLGDGTTTDRPWWAPVPGVSGVTQISNASKTCYALLSDGSLLAWGFDGNGELGDGGTTSRFSPDLVPGLSPGVSSITTGAGHALAVLKDGSLMAWGFNDTGQVGDGTQKARLSPFRVSGLPATVAMTATPAFASYALLTDGSVWSWGFNRIGVLGDGGTADRSSPAPVVGLSSGVKRIAAAKSTGYAVMADGSVRSWGGNASGEIGDGSTTNRLEPVPVHGLAGVDQLGSAQGGGYVLSPAGELMSWGGNSLGQIGDGTTTDRLLPVTISPPDGRRVDHIASMTVASNTGLVILKTT